MIFYLVNPFNSTLYFYERPLSTRSDTNIYVLKPIDLYLSYISFIALIIRSWIYYSSY